MVDRQLLHRYLIDQQISTFWCEFCMVLTLKSCTNVDNRNISNFWRFQILNSNIINVVDSNELSTLCWMLKFEHRYEVSHIYFCVLRTVHSVEYKDLFFQMNGWSDDCLNGLPNKNRTKIVLQNSTAKWICWNWSVRLFIKHSGLNFTIQRSLFWM